MLPAEGSSIRSFAKGRYLSFYLYRLFKGRIEMDTNNVSPANFDTIHQMQNIELTLRRHLPGAVCPCLFLRRTPAWFLFAGLFTRFPV